MRSFALWYSANEDLHKEVTVHVNLWDKKEINNKRFCFDFGLLIEDIEGIEKVYLYVPFKVLKNQIRDLGNVISNNKLVNAIFNESFTTTKGEPKRLIVNESSEKGRFIIYSLDIERQLILNKCNGSTDTPGTILEINIKDINIKPKDIVKYYFRIRIQVASEEVHLINDEIKDVSIFSNQFTNTEVIDFRLNDVRSCSEELREQFDKGNNFLILAVHYLILRNANDKIIHYGKEINSRMLEIDLWQEYIDGADYNIIAYHIKSKAKKDINNQYNYVPDFSDLTRFQYQKNTVWLITKYVLGIIVLGAIGGVLGNWLSNLIGLN